MPEIPELLDPKWVANQPGVVNHACRFDDHDGRRFVQIHGQSFYVYDLDDEVTEHFVWVQLHLAGYAKMVEIAAGTGIALRSLQRWKKRAEQGGFEALLPKPIPGRPRTLTATLRRQVLRAIDQGKSHDEIGKQFGLSGSSIDRLVAAQNAKHPESSQEQVQFDLEEDAPCFVVPELHEGDHDSQEQEQEQAQEKEASGSEARGAVGSGKVEIRCGRALCDPLDRGLDRVLAKLGMIEDADPLFAPGQRLDGVGFFMVVALLGSHPILKIFENIYGRTLAPAFYGLRSTVLTLLMMVLLRIRRPEHLRHHNPANLGRVLGLDRIMEVKTLRRKLHRLAGQNRGAELMEGLGRARLEGQPAPAEGELEILYLDGHVQCYHGGVKIGQTWSATRNRTVKGRTDTWLHLPGQCPLFYLESPFNESLVTVIKKHRGKIEQLFGGRKPVLVFDREGWDVSFLKELDEKGWEFITYRKGNYADLPVDRFEKTPTRIGRRDYAHAPADIAVQDFNLYEKTTGKTGKPARRRIGVASFREVRVLSDDAGKQTSVVTNLSRDKAGAVAVCAALFQRWANQENVFKYQKQEYDLDALLEYNQGERSAPDRRGEEQVPAEIEHPNPDHTRLTKKIGDLAKKQTKLLARYGLVVEKQAGDDEAEGIDAEQLAKVIGEIRGSKHGRELAAITAQLEQLRAQRASCEPREEVAPAGYARLRSGVKQIVDAVKMSAYDLESELFEMLGAHYPNRDKEGRKLIVSAMRSSGELRLERGKIVIKLEAQASPNRTRAIDAICEALNRRQATFPGTDLCIEFDTNRTD